MIGRGHERSIHIKGDKLEALCGVFVLPQLLDLELNHVLYTEVNRSVGTNAASTLRRTIVGDGHFREFLGIGVCFNGRVELQVLIGVALGQMRAVVLDCSREIA